ncbi:hypothetical protein K1719_020849 [Acacia pycnantha]|nr:hypothetical protein K1719_020849 [Acacia pycnantha]
MDKSVCTNKMLRTEAEVRDRISDLPDSLLLHILSFLPAKVAVATCLLCKRWRPLWPSLPSLDLKRQDFQRLKFFHQFVDKMLKFVDLKSVKKFVLRLGYDETDEYFRPQKISRWINAMMTTKVEHLELHLMPRKGDYELPSSVFTTNNIKVLMLSGSTGFVGWIRTVTVGTLSHVNLPLLEVLHLKDVKFSDDRSLGMLLSACALLKHLVLIDLYGKFNCPLDIGGLNHLVTADVPQFLFPLKVFSNARFLRFHLCMLQNLLLVKVTPVPDIPTFYNLTHLEFRYFSYDWNTTLKYLQSCPKLEILVIGQKEEISAASEVKSLARSSRKPSSLFVLFAVASVKDFSRRLLLCSTFLFAGRVCEV